MRSKLVGCVRAWGEWFGLGFIQLGGAHNRQMRGLWRVGGGEGTGERGHAFPGEGEEALRRGFVLEFSWSYAASVSTIGASCCTRASIERDLVRVVMASACNWGRCPAASSPSFRFHFGNVPCPARPDLGFTRGLGGFQRGIGLQRRRPRLVHLLSSTPMVGV